MKERWYLKLKISLSRSKVMSKSLRKQFSKNDEKQQKTGNKTKHMQS